MKKNSEVMEGTRRTLTDMPFDKVFYVAGGSAELCHATGDEVYIAGQWWNEYSDGNGDTHYGR